MQSNWAVLTGDVVGSSRLDPDERRLLAERLRAVASRVAGAIGELFPYPLDIHRGDSWQWALKRPELAPRVGLMLRALLRSSFESTRLDTRLSIGVGRITFIPTSGLEGADGEAFRLSGEGLERLTADIRMGIAFPAGLTSRLSASVDIGLALIDIQVQHWTQRQAEAIAGALAGLTQEEIGWEWVRRPVTQQAIAQHLDRAGWDAIERSLGFYERIIAEILSPTSS